MEIGIIGTPVIDPVAGTLYVVAKTVNSAVESFYLHALDITTGKDKSGSPAPITATYPGTGDGSVGGNIAPFQVESEIVNIIQRPALTLVAGNLYVAFGSYEDDPPYHGWVLVYDASTLQQVAVYNTTPNGGDGGIWMSGQGLVADSSNNIYLITGNSDADQNPADPDASCSYGESFLKLALSTSGSCAGQGISVLDYFKPTNYIPLNETDDDVGAGGAVAIPGTPYIVGGGKTGELYLVNTTPNQMGGYNASGDKVTEEWQADGGLWSSPVFWNASTNPTLYVWGVDDVLKAYQYSSGQFVQTPYAKGMS